ncbi:hypothetical protein jhhlp_002052 [Lomentospora prolificans]|uniref:Zn(2)-C6 fungal-type domain-containing protein n=1 Tax=Lomentospora prolificans TaxID=41688 RepID=A0A2N3ND02_9PEZI|nr:hypothetical protein jhhlp_002052 [Lomentospora prolificans]
MVYCGKPSKGCQNCRERKIACDQRMPGCRMCEKHNRICPGYRNIVDLMFRDESEHVIRRATKSRSRASRPKSTSPTSGTQKKKGTQRQERRARSAARGSVSPSIASAVSGSPDNEMPGIPSPGLASIQHRRDRLSPTDAALEPSFKSLSILTPKTTGPADYFSRAIEAESSEDEDMFLPSPEEDTWPLPPPSALDYTLSPSFQEQGVAFFFSRYVTATEETADYHNFDFIYEVWQPSRGAQERRVDAVLASMTAVGLAAMATLTRSPERLDWARQSYVTALRLINDALEDPEEATKDSTLLSVLILGTYEMLTGSSSETMQAWQGHMHGAAALAKLRGPGQFKSKVGIRMFLMLCRSITLSCLHRDVPIPETLIELRNELEAALVPASTKFALASPMYHMLQLRHDIKCGRLSSTQNIMQALLALDDEYITLVAGLPDTWQYNVVELSTPNPIAFTPVCHVYPSTENAATWNGLRSMRILVHETILSELLRFFEGREFGTVPMEYKVQFARSHRLLNQLRDATLASIPQHFGVVSCRDVRTPHSDPESTYFGPISITVANDAAYHVVSSPPSTFSTQPSPSPSSFSPAPEKLGRRSRPFIPTILDLLGPSDESADTDSLFMALSSSRSPVVWPLYLLGVSSTCTPDVRQYVVERLMAVYMETGLVQAKSVADAVAAREFFPDWLASAPMDGVPDVSGEPIPVRL